MLYYIVHILIWTNGSIARGADRGGLAMLNIGAMVLSYIVHCYRLLLHGRHGARGRIAVGRQALVGRHIERVALAVAVTRQAHVATCYNATGRQ